MNRFALGFAAVLLGASAATAFAAADDVNLTLKDHKFSPEGVTIPAGKKVKFVVKNLDATPAEFESDDFKAEKVIPAGKSAEILVGPLKAGTYEFHDEYHEAQSKTHLTVK
ncbi:MULTISPECIES: cupredoxin domain-containing protein [Burkholderia]|uniref:cupredoxin domain-containing protein n=1 Tax=Burkholderia TaxID=32008 RepID=UPI00157ADEBA|nr:MULTISPECIES: cupredoxin domain-containing protein [Burkholderia]MCU9952433.1 cupredoxin domain-containing protein [Burkholderia sp. BKH01]NTY38810.1 cupredoxin domain-containing protein [Burkholderia diffusa]